MDPAAAAHEPELWILVQRGRVQRTIAEYQGIGRRVWPVAGSYADARRLIEWLAAWREGVRPSRIGEVQGDSLEAQIGSAISDGCIGSCLVDGWNDDGSPRWRWHLFAESSSGTGVAIRYE